MSVKERLKIFAKSQEKSVRAFEEKCGLTIGYINAIRVSIQPDKIQRIASHYPDMNTGWLLTGNGKMLKDDSMEKSTVEEPPVKYAKCKACEAKDAHIKTLEEYISCLKKIIETLPEVREKKGNVTCG